MVQWIVWVSSEAVSNIRQNLELAEFGVHFFLLRFKSGLKAPERRSQIHLQSLNFVSAAFNFCALNSTNIN